MVCTTLPGGAAERESGSQSPDPTFRSRPENAALALAFVAAGVG
jgi:hypothetical protein